MTAAIAPLVPKTTYAERPLQSRPLSAQFAGLQMAGCTAIEEKFAKALLYMLMEPREYGPPNYVNLVMPRGAVAGMSGFPPIRRARDEGAINFMPECVIGAYRADFVVMVKAYGRNASIIKAAIECDGHDWHERTKEQVSYGRARDRQIGSLGITVLHYPGSDITSDAHQCARDALNVLTRMSIAGRG